MHITHYKCTHTHNLGHKLKCLQEQGHPQKMSEAGPISLLQMLAARGHEGQ